MSERSGIEIDYCPTWRGVWLDRGELDKILERSLSQPGPAAAPAPPPRQQSDRQSDQRYEQRQQGYQQGQQQPYRKKKESWLSELFD